MGRAVHPHIITDDSALGGSTIERSLRFNGADTYQHLTRTPSTSGNRKVWTFSAWIKIAHTDDGPNYIYAANNGNTSYVALYFRYKKLYTYFHPTNNYGEVSSRLFSDVGSWIHVVHQVDAGDFGQKIWINGEVLSLNSGRNPGNSDYGWNQSGVTHRVGNASWRNDNVDGYLADVYHTDGQLKFPSDFGYTESQTGMWRPKKYEGAYGTNGFHLDFSDNSAATAAALGKDRSGNANDFTPSNFSVAAGEGNDSLEDTPTNNFCTLDPFHLFTHNCTLSNGNLKATGSSEAYPGVAANIELSSGKWYYEFVINAKASNPMCGVCQKNYMSGGAGRIVYRADGRYIRQSGAEATGPSSFAVGDIIGIAIDLDDTAGNIRFYKNGTLQAIDGGLNTLKSSLSISTFGGGLYPYIQMYTNDACTVNFGQRPFSYTPPSGHRSISLNNLAATPSIIRPEKHMKTLVWAGNSTNNRVITGLEFQPDLVWIKKRNVSIMSHFFISSAQTYTSSGSGNGNVGAFVSGTNSTDGVGTTTDGGFVSFNRDGFTLGKGNNDADSGNAAYQRMNVNGANYVGWCWKAGGNSNTFNVDGTGYASASAAGITEGNLALTGASVNKEAGFSIVKFNANNSASATIGHGLNSKPELIIVKDTTTGDDWQTKFVDDNTYFALNSTGNGSASYADYTATDTVINLGYTWNNGSGLHVAYSWTSVPGYSKIGYYTGNADGNGPLIYTGFPIGWLMIKRSNGTGPFNIWDVSREPNGNSRGRNLDASSSAYEDTGRTIDFYSNGFKIRNSGTEMNNGNYLYLAFAKQSGTTSYQTEPNAQ